ncbi:MAG TPA: glycosyltransferase family 2 protein [Thermodesulfobacteriota bacterium]|nr:glycosyltransferase family 2 protein [Thermodesulfobacteriota bacterium]
MIVQILLSTYNGTKYIIPLMESLLGQDYPHMEILVRDDGSNDGTVELLREYAANHTNIKVVTGVNLGFAKSFFKLIEISSPNAGYIALCDQDDVWLRDKVSRAVEFLSRYPREIPALYYSRLAVVDENLKPLGYTKLPRKGLSFCNALVEGPEGSGCTILFNQAALQLLRTFPTRVYTHDWWIYLVVSGFGNIIYDKESRILYRQHDSNVFGIPFGVLEKFRAKIHRFKTGQLQYQNAMDQAQEFMRIYGSSLPIEHKRTLEHLLENRKRFWLDRLRYALSCEVYHQSTFEHFILKALIALNRL